MQKAIALYIQNAWGPKNSTPELMMQLMHNSTHQTFFISHKKHNKSQIISDMLFKLLFRIFHTLLVSQEWELISTR